MSELFRDEITKNLVQVVGVCQGAGEDIDTAICTDDDNEYPRLITDLIQVYPVRRPASESDTVRRLVSVAEHGLDQATTDVSINDFLGS